MTDDLDIAAGEDRRRPVLLGEAPSKMGDRYHHFPLSGRPARVLCELAGIPPQAEGSTYGRWTWALYERFECRNVFARHADATPWSRPRARDAVRELLARLKGEAYAAGRVVTEDVPVGTGGPQLETYRLLTGADSVKNMRVEVPPTVVVCLGRKVQAAVFGALEGDIHRPLSTAGSWGGGLFGNFGVWAAPWRIYTPYVPPGESEPVHTWCPHVVTIPHPSGLNRLLNDEAQRARCGEVLRRALELAAGTCTVPE